VLPTAPVANELAAAYGGPRRYQFAIVHDSSAAVLSASHALDADVPDPMQVAGFIAESRTVPIAGWTVYAGADPDNALQPTRSLLMRGALVAAAVLVVLCGALVIVNRRIGRPLRRVTDLVGDHGSHVADALADVSGPSEVVRLAGEFRATSAARDAYEAQLSHQALHDPLTGLPNRALLTERLRHSLERAASVGGTVGVVFIDLDRFKFVNDSLGHAVGDSVLIETATRLRSIVRGSDTLARFGGDEFVIVCDTCSDADAVRALAGRVLAAVEAPIEAGDTIVRITASAGVAVNGRTDDGTDLIRDADAAMYLAKERGRARQELFDAHLRELATRRLTLESEFRVAMDRGELSVVYQPKLDLRTGAVIGVEALLRWNHPALGNVPPSTFIPIAEETGLIVAVGRFVLERACSQLAAWRSEGLDLTMAVNLSGRQLAAPELADEISAILDRTGVDPSRLCLELTESLVMADTIGTADTMRALHDLGVQLSIDDFGTGYSSLAYLHRFPIDELKIDRAFVAGILEHPDQETLVRAMVAMGQALRISIVAEGVETPEQAARLRDLGCDTAQGYLFAKPQPPESLRALLHAQPIST
jgi:diguanylate cyclase (GGDEF)-like protein